MIDNLDTKFRYKPIRLKFLLERNDGGIWGDDPDNGENNYFILRSTEQAINGAWKIEDPAIRKLFPSDFEKVRLRTGDLVITKSSGSPEHIGKTSIVTDEIEGLNCGFSNFMQRIRTRKNVEPKYIFYLLNNYMVRVQFMVLSTTTTGLGNLTSEIINEVRVPYPDYSLQLSITHYLDHETEKIDALINAKQRFLQFLTEKRQTLISYTITHGINSSTTLRDSGAEWLGDIPSHWKLEFARWLFNEIDLRSETGDEELLSVSHLTGVTPRSEKDVNMFMAETNEGYKICQPGDLVINTLWAWMGAMGVAFQHGIVSPAYNVYRQTGQYNPRYLDYLVRIPNFAKEATRYSKGVWSSRLRLYPEEFFLIQMPIPPLDEQQAIVDYLDREINKIDDLSEATQSSIALLSERRAALISAAVTGQIEIPEASCN